MEIALARYMRGSLEDKIDVVFNMCNASGNGFINRRELYRMLKSFDDGAQLEGAKAMEEDDLYFFVETFMEEVDRDGDSIISLEEFTRHVKAFFSHAKTLESIYYAFDREAAAEARAAEEADEEAGETNYIMITLCMIVFFLHNAGYWDWTSILYPTLVEELSVNATQIGLMFVIPSFIALFYMPVGGIIVAYVGPYRTLAISSIICFILFLVSAYAWQQRNFTLMLIARSLSIQFDIVDIAATVLMSSYTSPNIFATVFAISGAMCSVGNIFGRVVIPQMAVDDVFWLYLPANAFAILLMSCLMPLVWRCVKPEDKMLSLQSILGKAFFSAALRFSDIKVRWMAWSEFKRLHAYVHS